MTSASAHYLQVLDFASTDFDARDPVRIALDNVIRYIASNPTENLRYLTFGILRDAAKLESNQGEILHRMIAYLTGERAKILHIVYEYVDDDFEHELNTEETDIFIADESFCDPRTGYPVADCANSIYVFFRPNYTAFH
ncbi:MAG: hypothetical protein HYR68_12220 [Burkholderiales bacterium]|nr:hypothetical protein [Burkholderiales bacterium]MBI3728790.1 hypothetical protein [Burkholderiales bacterium]